MHNNDNEAEEWRERLPGSILLENDQLVNGPVTLRTATHTSFRELKATMNMK